MLDEDPVYEEAPGFEGLEARARALAAKHIVAAESQFGPEPLARFEKKARQLVAICGFLNGAIHNRRAISPAAQQLVDTLPIIEDHLREIRRGVAKSHYDELPKLKDGVLAGFPRIYAISLALLARTDGGLEVDSLKRFILAYQSVKPLTDDELWNLDITLRLVLVENLQRTATRILNSEDLEGAEALRKLEIVERHPAELTTLQVPMENILANMRFISTINWRAFLESVSVVNLILCEDPAAAYPLMEYTTRDCYRRVIGRIAKQTKMPAQDIARRAIQFASEAQASRPTEEHLAHVGYYLIDNGRLKLEENTGYKPLWRERYLRTIRRHPTAFCLGALAFLTATVLALLVLYANHVGTPALILVGLTVLLLIPASELAVKILNAILIFEPPPLPRMDFAQGIREELQTMIVVPAIFSSEATICELLETIEAHYLANQDDHISFALLGDWSDAAQERMPDDDTLLEVAMKGIKELNVRYQQGSLDRFYLFHRCRQWNHSEEKWIGWERKRGKLREFNRLLRGALDTSYIVCTAGRGFLAGIRYVITLDSDTQLPRDAARRLIGAISHPLNRPKLDVISGRVIRGYAVVQPCVRPSPPCAPRARIPMILSNYIQVNPDTKVMPDIYQSLFGEGIYVGKGLYEVDAFEAALKDRVPENSLLSHDLFESLHARTVTVRDIEVTESQRVFYAAFMKRLHRWIRGDWQLLPWLLPKVGDANGNKVQNVLTTFARWKILDNLRRSLILPTLLLWFVAAWTVLPGSVAYWMLLILLLIAVSIYLPMITAVLRVLPDEISGSSLLESTWYIAKACAVQAVSTAVDGLFLIIFLAHQSGSRVDAVARTLYRLIISRKHLLEWSTTAGDQSDRRYDLVAFLFLTWPSPIIALVAGALILISKPTVLIQAAPFLIAWLAAPLFAYWLNRQMSRRANKFDGKADALVRLNARRASRDLESLANNENHRLSPGISPNNSGSTIVPQTFCTSRLRLLLWTVAAHGLGCTGILELADRLESSFAAIESRNSCGHDHNCEGLQLLKPRAPQRILTIENGNLAGHLQTLKQVCLEIVGQPLFGERVLKGLIDTIALMKEETTRLGVARARKKVTVHQQLLEEIEACAALLSAEEQEKSSPLFSAWYKLLNSLAQQASVVSDILETLSREQGESAVTELRFWTDALIHQTRELNRDLCTLAPWTTADTRQLATIIKRYDPETLGQWNRIMKMLDRVPAISDLPEPLTVLNDLVELCAQLERRLPTTGLDRLTVLNGFDVLARAIEEACALSKDLLSRYARLAQRSETLAGTLDFRSLFDEERRVPGRVFQSSQCLQGT
jgi:cyclic beta-1,2-glucan synthetase